jgi:hypothetical protein
MDILEEDMSDIEELEKYYFDTTGNDLTFLENHSIPKTEFATLALFYDICFYNSEEAIRLFITDYRKAENVSNDLYPHLREFYEFYKSIFNNTEHKRFFELCANIYLDKYRIQPNLENYGNNLFLTPIENTTFIDLISGFNFYNFYDHLNNNTLYYLIDKTLMTCTCLELGKQRKKIDNVVILNCDIKDIERKQIEGDISLIRINNGWRYVGDFYNYIEKYKSMVMQNGIFLFQEHSEHRVLFQDNSPYKIFNIHSYFQGWEQSYLINFEKGRIFDSLIFKKI